MIKRAAPNNVFERLVAEIDAEMPSESVTTDSEKPGESVRAEVEKGIPEQLFDDDPTQDEHTDSEDVEAAAEASDVDSADADHPPPTRRRFRRITRRKGRIAVDEPRESVGADAEKATPGQLFGGDPTEDEPADSEDVEAAAEASDVDSAEADDPPPTRRRSRRITTRRMVQIAAGLIVVGVLAGSGFVGWQLKQRVDNAAAEKAALEAARNYAVTLSTMDSNDIDKNISHVLDGATGEFKSMYGHASAQLRQLLVDNKAVSHGTVIDAGIKSASENKAEVMLFLDQSVSNAVNPEPRIDRLRMLITMEKVDQRWLASKLDIE